MSIDFDAIIIGAGPAGATAAIRLAEAGWSVALVEKRAFPRRKVCGECIAASNLPLLDALGVGNAFRAIAGPELRRVGLFVGANRIVAPLPPLENSAQRWGRALGREHLDTMLVQRARDLGAQVWQPCTVRQVDRDGQHHTCTLTRSGNVAEIRLRAPVLIHAQGSWEPAPRTTVDADNSTRRPRRDHDLLAFKATWRNARIEPGLLPVLAFPGGYGGMVLGDHGLTTLAFCVRRDVLQSQRARSPGRNAALAALAHVQASCAGVGVALTGAERVERWLAVGPLQPGIRKPWRDDGSFAVGNAAGEAHPILGEGISMAIQSAWLLCDQLVAHRARSPANPIPASSNLHAHWAPVGRDYARAWHANFAPRLRFAAVCAHLAMRPHAARALMPLLARWPGLLTQGARVAGKVRRAAIVPPMPIPDPRPAGAPG